MPEPVSDRAVIDPSGHKHAGAEIVVFGEALAPDELGCPLVLIQDWRVGECRRR